VSSAPRNDAAGRAPAGRAGAMLTVSDLSVEYAMDRGTVVAVDNVSFHLDPGEFIGIVGESGCGKSTLLFAIAQLLVSPAAITGGSVIFQGQNMVGLTDKQMATVRWKDMSVVMQSAMNALNPVKSIEAQFRDAMWAHGRTARAEVAARSAEMLLTPDLVIMDEPTSALDVVAQRSLMVQIKELQEELGFAVIFVTHDMSLVSHFSDRLMVMYAGQVAELGPTRHVFDSPLHPYSAGLLDAFPSIRGPRVPLTGIPGSPPDLARPPPGCRFAPRCPKVMSRCEQEAPELYGVDGISVRCFLHDEGGASHD
jgi:peptide/nickel transport system ATP-binding protein